MSLLRIDPFRSFEALARRMDDFSSNLNNGITIERGGFNPRVDITETDTAVNVQVELAGMKKEDVRISLNEENILSISGERKQKEETKDRNYWRSEINYGSFERKFVLNELAKTENITASFDDGILNIVVPKKESAKPKEINVEIN